MFKLQIVLLICVSIHHLFTVCDLSGFDADIPNEATTIDIVFCWCMNASALRFPSCAIGTVERTCSSVKFRAKTTCASGSLVCHAAITTPSFLSAVAAESVQVSKAQLLWFSNIEQSVRGRFHCCNTSQKPYTPGLCIACTSWRQCYPRIQLLVQIACKPLQHLTRSLVHGLVCHHCIVPVTTLR